MIRIADIVVDGGTQVRESINEHVVTEYAERLSDGVEFPAVIVFHDGNRYYLADGFHRVMAHSRVGRDEIAADVRPGTREDAVWCALGANKANGQRMTERDKQHAVAIALKMWPERMQREIADQVGCHPSLVSNVYQKMSASEPVLRGRALATETKRSAVKNMLSSGASSADITRLTRVSNSFVSRVRAELGMSRVDKSKSAIASRRERLIEMAASGYTTRQIAAEIGIAEDTCRDTCRRLGVDVPGDVATAKTKRHDSTRMVEHIVMDAENLTADVNLIDFASLDGADVAAWVDSLQASKRKLGAFIQRLIKETKHEAA